MSADNWTVCPACEHRREKELDSEGKKVSALYGKVSVEAFDAERKLHEAKRVESPPHTWREDWEIGVFEDSFFVDYRGRCTMCQTTHKFRQEALFDPATGTFR